MNCDLFNELKQLEDKYFKTLDRVEDLESALFEIRDIVETLIEEIDDGEEVEGDSFEDDFCNDCGEHWEECLCDDDLINWNKLG